MTLTNVILAAIWRLCYDTGNLFTRKSVRVEASTCLTNIDENIEREVERIRQCEIELRTAPTPAIKEDIRAEIDDSRRIIARLETDKEKEEQDQNRKTGKWGAFVLIMILASILLVCIVVQYVHQQQVERTEILRIENERREAFVTARENVAVYLNGIEQQLKPESDTQITFEVEGKLETLTRFMQGEPEINETSKLRDRAASLNVAADEHNRRVERLPFDVPFAAAGESALRVTNELPYDPTLLNEEALQTAGENAKSVEDEQNVQTLQNEFDRIRRVSYQQSFSRVLATAKSFLEEQDIERAKVPMEAAREIFNAHREAMRPEAETDLLAVEREHEQLVRLREIEAIAGNFVALFDRAAQSYQDASQNPDDWRDELLDTDALDRAEQLLLDVPVADQARFTELKTRFTALQNNALVQRSQRLTAQTDLLASDYSQIVADNDLTPPQRYDALKELLDIIITVSRETDAERINRRPITPIAQTRLDQLIDDVKKDWQEVYPQAITQTVGDLDLYLAELRHVSSLRDFRSPDFLRVLENPAAFCFETTRTWNQFVKENAADLDIHPPSLALAEKILALLDKDTTGLASVPEVVLMRANRSYYEETILRKGRLRDYLLQFRRSDRGNDPYLNLINQKITDIANTANSPRQAMLAFFDLLEQITRDGSEPPCFRLRLMGTLINSLVMSHRDFPHRDYLLTTTSWRSRSANTLFVTIPDGTRCRNKTCEHHKAAATLLADLPIGMLRAAAQRLPSTMLPEPPRELSRRQLAVEYVWVGWADRSADNPPEVFIRIKQENIPKTNFGSALYATLPGAEVMSVIGDLAENRSGIVPVDKEIRCGTPVYVRRQWIPEQEPSTQQ